MGKQDSEKHTIKEEKPTVEEKRWQILANVIIIPLLICMVYLLIYGGWMVYTEPLEGDIVYKLTGFLAKILIFPVVAIITCMGIASGSFILWEGNRRIFIENKIERFEKIEDSD